MRIISNALQGLVPFMTSLLTIVIIHASISGAYAQEAKRQAFFGELHLHTGFSTDAYINGTRKDPVTSYRFAQGDPVMLQDGRSWQLSRPLDFVAITDHAESFGDMPLCTTPGSVAYDKTLCKTVRDMNPIASQMLIGGWNVNGAKRPAEICGEDGRHCVQTEKATWSALQEAANFVNSPGEFTALIGYEYSPVILREGSTSKIHRNVIFRGSDVPDRAFSSYDGTIENLHAWLDDSCPEPCRALTIPHNTNASASRIFWPDKNSDGSPWTKEILERRARLEPLVEIYQGKGSSECHPGLGLTDEECGFEQWVPNCKAGETEGCSTANDMVRDTLVRGLIVEKKWGINPFKLGFIGSTDSHLGTPGATEEDDYRGQLGNPDSTPARRLGLESYYDFEGLDVEVDSEEGGWGFTGPSKFSPGGLAVVWAGKNTREEIWDALARRETFSTSGTRIQVRFFGGFDYPKNAHKRRDAVKLAYRKGVPMGGEITSAPTGESPTFIVSALRDPESAPLQKLQIIKGWVENGEERSQVYDVACSDGASPDQSGRCPSNEAGIDLSSCKVDETKGAAQLGATWTDPHFDASSPALYYVRVLENPVCRWSTHDALRIGAQLPAHVPASIKERAWTSPIWYAP